MKKGLTSEMEKEKKVISDSAKAATVDSIKKEKAALKMKQTKLETVETQKEKAGKIAVIEAPSEQDTKQKAKKETKKKETAQKEKKQKASKVEVFVQFSDKEVITDVIVEKVKKAYVSEGNKLAETDDIRVYIKPEENMIYYVINDSYASGTILFE